MIPDALPLVRVKFPPTDDAATLRAVVPLSIVALPDDPVVFKVTAPVNAFAELRVMSALLTLVVKEEVPAIVKTPLSKISLPDVGPLLVAIRLPAVMLLNVMSPLVRFVFPVPALIVAVKTPVPVFIVVPEAKAITAVPESRCASTTPLEVRSFAISVRLPLSVVIFALTRTERPACKVRLPPLPLALFAVTVLDTVMSLLACRTTFVPADKAVAIVVGVIVEALEEFVAKTAELIESLGDEIV